MTASKPHSVPNPEVVKAAVQGEGGCGEVSPDGLRACIMDIGHEGSHGWESNQHISPRAADHARELIAFQGEPKVIGQWFASARSMARDYLDALSVIEGLEEQLEAAQREANLQRTVAEANGEDARNLYEQLQTAQAETRTEWQRAEGLRFDLAALKEQVQALELACDHHKMFWQKAEERERGLKEQFEVLKQAAQEVETLAFRQYVDWMHFHELAMARPFEAESEAQNFARRVSSLLTIALGADTTIEVIGGSNPASDPHWPDADGNYELSPEQSPASRPEQSPATKTHGRGCPCTPCQAEDWDAIDAGLRASSPAMRQEGR